VSAAVLVALFGVGTVVGLLSGLVGIGGGVLIVPLLYLFYDQPQWSGAVVAPELRTTIAHATSLAVIVPTAVRGALAYRREKLVAWDAALPIALASLLAAVAGARLAVLLPGEVLRLSFGVFLMGAGAQLVLRRTPRRRAELRLGLPLTVGTGAAVGLLSAVMGLGGGLIAIPMLIYVVRLDVERVAATSLAVVAFAATAGAVTYAASGGALTGRPPASLGYVHVAAAVPILLGSLVSVRWGARLNQRMSTRALRLLFGAVFMAFGAGLALQQLERLLHR
jgi:uncharacterized protein